MNPRKLPAIVLLPYYMAEEIFLSVQNPLYANFMPSICRIDIGKTQSAAS